MNLDAMTIVGSKSVKLSIRIHLWTDYVFDDGVSARGNIHPWRVALRWPPALKN